jgi:hypothetical protein
MYDSPPPPSNLTMYVLCGFGGNRVVFYAFEIYLGESGEGISHFQAVLIIAGYLLGAGKPYYALALLGLIIPQVFFQVKHDS